MSTTRTRTTTSRTRSAVTTRETDSDEVARQRAMEPHPRPPLSTYTPSTEDTRPPIVIGPTSTVRTTRS
ncbi:hypothetical protein [Amycolatopsis sp. NPDC006125]|uniref:hypothetical protein n=1 Tax=Amycolatopsis sp. NPDC006125 TaxID=3156730 RepID=UPI0033A6220A